MLSRCVSFCPQFLTFFFSSHFSASCPSLIVVCRIAMFPMSLTLLLILLLYFSSYCSGAAIVTGSPTVPHFAGQRREALTTRFSTIWLSGDPSKSRTAEISFDARIDLDRSLWGFCPVSVFVASDCGLAGNCIDRHACSRGCGKGGGLTTFTW